MNKIYASVANKAFYDSAVHSEDQLPADAVEISKELHQSLLEGVSSQSKMIDFTSMPPVLVDLPEPSGQVLAMLEAGWRDSQLRRTDEIVMRHRDEREMGGPTTLTSSEFMTLMGYRKTLRDWPQSDLFPDSRFRPAEPQLISSLTQ
ncbi:phage tail protein [Pseudomonas sp. TE21394]